MEEWKEYKLGELGRIVTGKTPKTSIKENYGGDIPFLTPSDDLTNKYAPNTNKKITQLGLAEVKNCLLPPNSICVSCIGSDLGKVVMLKDYSVTNQQFNSIIPSDEFCPDFIYYLMTIVGKELNFIGKTSTAVPIVNKSSFSNTEVAIPSLATQQKIANILSSLDDKIEVNRRINEQLEELAQALFKSWFVDFEPFKDGEFVESELGMIPKGWKVYQLEELVNIISGYSYKGNELMDSDIAMATIKNFERSGGFKVDGYKEIIPSSKLKETQKVSLYDVIVAHTDLTQNADIIGNPAMIMSYNGYKKLIISMDLVKVEPIHKDISNGFLYTLLKDERFKRHALGFVNGTTVLHLSKKALPNYKVALPTDLSECKTISKTLDNLYIREANNYSEIESLTTLRDTLLPKLMSGEIDVNEVKI